MNAIGVKTTRFVPADAQMAVVTSWVPLIEAWTWSSPLSRCTRTFSTIMMAFEIKVPKTVAMPKSVIMLMVKPEISIRKSVETIDVGMAIEVMTVRLARPVNR